MLDGLSTVLSTAVEETCTTVYFVAVTDGRVLRGAQTRAAVLAHAVGIASVEGLDALSIGRLAGELAISKSGVFARFGAKEELQLATIAAADEIFTEEVIRPALAVPPGVRRLRRLCVEWLRYSRERVFPGGCFFVSVGAYDARPGRLRDALVARQRTWVTLLERTAEDARLLGQLTGDSVQLAFELEALFVAANARSLLGDDRAYVLAESAIKARLA
jgi:AcrR family transcriptional regulator